MTQTNAINTSLINAAKNSINQNFFNVDGVVERLELSIAMNTIQPRSGNVIFYGKGGYGKTEIVAEFLRIATGQEPFVVNMNQATTTFDIYGGINLPELTQRGQLEYQFDSSFMAHEWVIFEEGLEPRQKVLSSLKYILTSGIFAAAGQANNIPIKTKGIVIVTNVDTADFMEADDTKAFLERFPIQYKVGWEGLNHAQRFDASLKVVQKFDGDNQIGHTHRKLIAENLSVRLESPRMIARLVQSLIARQSMLGGGMITDATFTSTMAIMGYGDKSLSEKIEQERINAEVLLAKQQYQALFDQLGKNMVHYESLDAHVNDPKYIAKLAGQFASTMALMDEISNSIVDIRTNPNYGTKGNELASWINTKIGEFSDKMDAIKHKTWDSVLKTVVMLVDKLEETA